MKVAVAFDHRGVRLRDRTLEELAALGHEAVDLGTDSSAVRIDYPDKAREVGEAILEGRAERGVLVCGSGVGASVAACKLPGIRAAICHDTYSAHQGVEHDDMNVLCLGSEVVGGELAAELVRTFLGARFDGGERYVKRLEKIVETGKDGAWPSRNFMSFRSTGSRSGSTRSRATGSASGFLEQLMREDAVVGVTSNPTIFQKALAEGELYDEQLREILREENDPKEIFYRLAVKDIQDACDLFRPVWDGGGGKDGYVSMEVDPTLAYDRDGTVDEALRLHEWIDRPNLFVKIPATEPGLGAIEECIALGHSINVTLIFSLDRYAGVAEAYLRGLERLVESGGDPSTVASVASFFVSRVDTEADRRLDEVGASGTEGQARDREREARLPALQGDLLGPALGAARGSRRDSAALSLGVDVDEEPGLPRHALRRGADRPGDGQHDAAGDDQGFPGPRHGRPTRSSGGSTRRSSCSTTSSEAGVDYDDVTDTLEREGVQKFSDSFDELLEGIRAKRTELAAA